MKISESTINLFTALNQVVQEINNPKNKKINPYFKSKYAPLSDILDGIKPLLAKNGLFIVQELRSIDGKVGVCTLITHTSGEWLETEPFLLTMDKDTAQGAGSCVTYARRYALSAILGISSEDDDDGNAASGKAPKITEEDAMWFITDVVPVLRTRNVPATKIIDTANKFLYGVLLKETIINSINKER